MDNTLLSQEILTIAESAGLTAEEVRDLLSGSGVIPEALKDVLERVGNAVSETCSDD
jgi:hypothetical protein